MRIVLASHNTGKLAEFQALLAPLNKTIISQLELGIDPLPEISSTFVENALDKARHASSKAGLPALADDSGLVVTALQGEPGIRSARFAGEQADSADNNRLLLRRLHGVSDRAAHFYCVVVYLNHALDPAPLIAVGRWPGKILTTLQGEGGFGYDPLFLPDDQQMSVGNMSATLKNQLSHRSQAVATLIQMFNSS